MVRFPTEARDMSYTKRPDRQWVSTQRLTLWVLGGRRVEADHSQPPRAEVKNGWSYTLLPLLCLHDVHRDFVFILI